MSDRDEPRREGDSVDWAEVRDGLISDETGVAKRRNKLLAQLRQGSGVTQEDVAEQMGVTQARISAIEGRSIDATNVATLLKYFEALGMKLRIIVDAGGGREVTILER